MSTKDPLKPLEFIIGVIAIPFIVAFGLFLPMAFFGSASFGSIGSGEVCVQFSPDIFNTARYDDREPDVLKPFFQTHPLRGLSSRSVQFESCDRDAGTGLTLISGIDSLLTVGFPAGMVFLLWRLTRKARRDGLFDAGVATRVGWLGWYLLAGGLLVSLIGAAIKTVVFRELLGYQEWNTPFHLLDFPWASVIVGFGLITLGRVLAQTVMMREEIDATV